MFLYNVHTPTKTFALLHKGKSSLVSRLVIADSPSAENETQQHLYDRILKKADLGEGNGANLQYEFEGGRWSLDDDDDLQILSSRFPFVSTPSVTIHLQPSHPDGRHHSHGRNHQSHSGSHLTEPPAYPSSLGVGGRPKSGKNRPAISDTGPRQASTSKSSPSHLHPNSNGNLASRSDARSVSGLSTRSRAVSTYTTASRKSKWGDPESEPMGDVMKREFEAFREGNGVRTVWGDVGTVKGVRMLLKAGYRHVYVSRKFAIKHSLVPKKFGARDNFSGLTALPFLVPITVGNRTEMHKVFVAEDEKFDVVLGRSWVEKMGVKIDPLDPTLITYMDSGEQIHCDTVIMRDTKGEIITIT